MTQELPRRVVMARMLRSTEDHSEVQSAVIRELDQIGDHSSSYPYLALSRRIGARYGDVLWFVDHLECEGPFWRPSQRHRDALARLTEEQRLAIARRLDEVETGRAP